MISHSLLSLLKIIVWYSQIPQHLNVFHGNFLLWFLFLLKVGRLRLRLKYTRRECSEYI